MNSNEKQSTTGASGESHRSETAEAEKNPQDIPLTSAASSHKNPQGNRSEEVSTCAHQNCNESDPAQLAVAAFLRKGESNAERYLEIIDKMMCDYHGYRWAESTLMNIYDFIEEHGYITEGQMTAIDNIKNSNTYGNRHSKSRRSRR